ncbi:phage portal protein [Streptomyces sp. BBFR109]|uniref:phage portal protein n=1 Tax=Streptomyces sp. BBFR109 TaxID=3448172 RepID=UPI003F75E281
MNLNPLRIIKALSGPMTSKSGNVHDLGHSLGGADWRYYGGAGSFEWYKQNDYENAYPSIRVISQGFAAIEPYTMDKQGNAVASNLLNRLYTPNRQMSAYDFREALAVMSLIHRKVYIRVHHKGENINMDSITGFTFLEGVSEHIVDNHVEYWLPNAEKLTPAEVIVLKNINPYNLNDGFSPAFAARRWTRLDDLIADFQTGFFNNGAVPAGQFIVTAKTVTDYQDIVKGIKEHHQGAGRNNNVMFAHKPLGVDGKPMDAQIEWVPFNSQNKDMALKDLFEQANKKIDSTYGVPASLRGVNDANTFASVRVDELLFAKYTLNPFTLKIWQKFTHELNRITSGLGVAVTYELEMPQLADEEKVKAEAKQTDAQTVINLTQAGYTVESAVKYVEGGDIKVLEKIPSEDKKPEVVDDDRTSDTPDQPVDPTYKSPKNAKVVTKQLSARDIPDLYEGTGVNPDDLGCIMIDTEALEITSFVQDGEADLVNETDRHAHQMGAVAEIEPHITLLYGLLENGNTWKDKVDAVLDGWSMSKATIENVDFFETPDSYAVVAHIEKTTELVDGHERLTLLPHIQTFSEYRPHMTLAYIQKTADVDKWVKSLGDAYNGKTLKVTGINYGDPPTKGKSALPKAKALSPEDRATYESRLTVAIKERMSAQINAALELVSSKDVTPDRPVDLSEDDALAVELARVLLALVDHQGPIEHGANVELLFEAGIDTTGVSPFTLTNAQRLAYEAYLRKVATSYNAQTAERIRNILKTGREQGLSAADMRRQLKGLINEDWRINRLVVSEINAGGNTASLLDMQNVTKQTGARVQKLWEHIGPDAPCPLCVAMLSMPPIDVFEEYVQLGETIELPDGKQFTNDFMPIDGSRDPHPHGHCRQIYRVVKA